MSDRIERQERAGSGEVVDRHAHREATDRQAPRRAAEEPLVPPERTVREQGAPVTADTPAQTPLFSEEEANQLRTRWEAVQAGFVDEPRRSVEEADGLVRAVMERLTDGFAQQRARLEHEWGSREQVSTEDLRLALRHYRSFFDRLLRL